MGRAYEVRKASIQKTGAIKAKTYALFSKEIYQAAKSGVPEIESNTTLKRIVEKAKKNQVPNDIIKRAIDKAAGAGMDDYKEVIYEGFGPGASTLIIKCLTDNVNRTVGMVRAAFNKVNKSLGVSNSVLYNYDHLAITSFKSDKEEQILESLIMAEVEPTDFEVEEGFITISTHPADHNKTKDIIETIISDVDYVVDEIGMYPKDKIILNDEDNIQFDKLYHMLDEIEDVVEVYHNIEK